MNTERKELDTNRRALSPLGMGLIALGAIALLSQMGIFRGLGGLVPALLFGASGYYLVRRHYRSKESEVSMLCLGFGLLGLAAASLLGPLSGAAFLGLTAFGFLLAYSENRNRWWALIPGGVLLTLAVVAALGAFALPLSGGTIFFLGLAALFGYLYRHPTYPQPWAFYPAVTLLALGLLTIVVGGGWLFPLALIALGIYLLDRHQGGRVDWQGAATSAAHTVEGWFDAAERTLRNLLGGNPRPQGDRASEAEPQPAPARTEQPQPTPVQQAQPTQVQQPQPTQAAQPVAPDGEHPLAADEPEPRAQEQRGPEDQTPQA